VRKDEEKAKQEEAAKEERSRIAVNTIYIFFLF
jgi:hypothetical protein